jgi:methionine-rich copper-binding protein CopC
MRRSLAAIVAALVASAVLAPAALAHVQLKSSSPKAKSTVRAPSTVVLTFTGPIRSGTLTVKSSSGSSATSGKSGRDPRNINRLRVPLKSGLKAGKYNVKAKIVAADGHKETFTLWFKIKR